MQRPASSSGPVRRWKTTPERKQGRPQTSLGFAAKANSSNHHHDRRSSAGGGIRRRGAFFTADCDVREYFRLHGATAGLNVGVNGQPSADATLLGYVADCRREALLREKQELEMAKEEEDRWAGLKERVPLCWDAPPSTTHAFLTANTNCNGHPEILVPKISEGRVRESAIDRVGRSEEEEEKEKEEEHGEEDEDTTDLRGECHNLILILQ